MKTKHQNYATSIAFFAITFLACTAMAAVEGLSQWVDTRIGANNGNGTCILGPCVPHGSIHPSPDTVWYNGCGHHAPPNGWWQGDKVEGFSQLHAQGTGGTPSYGLFRVKFGAPSGMQILEAHPYLFRCELTNLATKVEIAATHNGAIYRYSQKHGRPTIDAMCKIGRNIATTNLHVTVAGDKVFGGGEYFGNWNPKPYQCYFYATHSQNELRIAVSFKSVDEAQKFHDNELQGRSVEEIAAAAKALWDEKLRVIEVEGVDDAAKTRFYTHFAHTMVQPRQRGELWDDHYTIWDTWKTLFPLMALTDPATYAQIVNSFARRLEQNGACEVGFTQLMEMRTGQGGNDVDNIIGDACAKGIEGIDWQGAWKVLAAHAADRTPDYIANGYVASDVQHDYCWRLRSASSTLGFAYNDWCAACVAAKLGKQEEAARLLARSHSWTNVWHAALVDEPSGIKGFVCGRHKDGTWGAPFVGKKVDDATGARKGYNSSFYEGTCWEYSFNVWHDLPLLMELCGGQDKFLERLKYAFENKLIDFGNEPSFYTALLFAVVGRPDLTAQWIHEQLATFPENGAPGDDDSGAMGSLYVFLNAGFMPFAATGEYVVFPPSVPRITFNLTNGKKFTIYREGNVGNNYKVKLNGRFLAKPFITHSDILAGGNLVFTN